jgi:ribosomal protein L7/L12
MLMELRVNGHASRIASVADLRRNLALVASQQFREIWLSIDNGGPSLGALMNTNVGVLTYLRHDEGDTGFGSRNPMYDGSDTLGGLAFDGLYRRQHVPVITYRLSNGQEDEFPASWALPESDIMRAMEYFVQHEGRRSPFVRWHDDEFDDEFEDHGEKDTANVAEGDFADSTQRKFTVVLQSAGQMKIEVIREVRFFAGLGLQEAKDLVEDAPKDVKEGIGRNEAEKIKAALEKAGATVAIKCNR